MPFKSAKQRALFHALKNDPALRKQYGISLAEVLRMIGEDPGGSLPVSAKTRSAVRS